MAVKIGLRLAGIDLRDPRAHAQLDIELHDVFFEATDSLSLAIVLTDDPDPVTAAATLARSISRALPDVRVAGVHDELVSTADIAARCDLAPETVRLWATGKRRTSATTFPTPRQVVGTSTNGRTMNLWAWRDVLTWIRDVIGIDPDENIDYLDDASLARLDAELTRPTSRTHAYHVQTFVMPVADSIQTGLRHHHWNQIDIAAGPVLFDGTYWGSHIIYSDNDQHGSHLTYITDPSTDQVPA